MARDEPDLFEPLEADRSNHPLVRNPLLELKEFQAIVRECDVVMKKRFRHLLLELRDVCAAKAEHAWRKKKAPMAVYWKVVSVLSWHVSRAFR